MKFRIKQEGSWFYPQYRQAFIWFSIKEGWGHSEKRFYDIEDCKEFINSHIEWLRLKAIKPKVTIHRYP